MLEIDPSVLRTYSVISQDSHAPDSGVFGMVGLGEINLAPGLGTCFRVSAAFVLVAIGSS